MSGRYRIERGLGEGGLGVVFVARDEVLHDRRVVIKMPLTSSDADRTIVERFAHEVKALAVIDHPGIVSALDSGVTEDGQPFLVMQYVDGQPLNEVIPHEGLPLDAAARILKQIGHALGAAHAQKILHRDLKPANVMLQRTPEGDEYIRLIDFGIASIRESLAKTETQTVVAGTLSYMAPEQLDGRVSVATDIYALAVIAYELLTGRRPFAAKTAVSMATLQKSGVRLRPSQLRPDIPPQAERLILQGLAYNPQDRPQSAATFADGLARALLDHVDIESRSSSATTRSPSLVQRMSRFAPRLAVVATAVAVIGAIATYVAWTQFRSRERPAPPAVLSAPAAPQAAPAVPSNTAQRQSVVATALPEKPPPPAPRSTRPTPKSTGEPAAGSAGASRPSRKASPAEACESGDASGCFELAEMYSQGRGVTKDDAQAASFYERSCSKGLAAACYGLALAYRDERGVAKNPTRSVELLERGCSGGVSDACDNLGLALGAANGVARDDARAARLFQQACDAGTGSACSHLAAWLSLGRSVSRDDGRATAVSVRACDLGYLVGCVVAGGHYRNGAGVPRDLKHAADLFERACNGGDSGGCNNLGLAYARNEGVPADQVKSVDLLQQACSMGNWLACTNIGDHYLAGAGVEKDPQHAAQIFQDGCDKRVGRGCVMAARAYALGDGVARDLQRAAEFNQRACDLKFADGCANLANAYAAGRGVQKDTTRADFFSRQADALRGPGLSSAAPMDGEPVPTGEFSGWMSGNEFRDLWNDRNVRGFRPTSIEGRLNTGREEFRARWERSQPGCQFHSEMALIKAAYEAQHARFTQQGYRVVVTQFTNLAGTTTYSAVWTKGCESR